MITLNPVPMGNDSLHTLLERRGRSWPQLLLARYVGLKSWKAYYRRAVDVHTFWDILVCLLGAERCFEGGRE